MNTPKTKSLSLANSKYLTPCRTTGLKRKSCTPQISSSSSLNSISPVGNGLHKSFHRKLTPEPKNVIPTSATSIADVTPKKPKTSDVSDTKPTSIKESLKEKVPGFQGFATKENVLELISDINEKTSKLKEQEHTTIYKKKHNIKELKETTNIWKEAFREAVIAVHEELKSRGHEVSIATILKEHGISFEDAGFHEENMEFE